MWDGDGDGPEDEGDDGEQQHGPREGRLVLRAPTAAIADEENRL